MNLQAVLMNVADLNRSIDFYREVLGFTLLAQREQLASMSAPESGRSQVIVLREIGSSPIGGGRHIGLRAFVVEVESADHLERIASDLDSRRLLVSRRNQSEWTAVVGHDPDEVAIVVTFITGGLTEHSWTTLDDLLYGIGE